MIDVTADRIHPRRQNTHICLIPQLPTWLADFHPSMPPARLTMTSCRQMYLQHSPLSWSRIDLCVSSPQTTTKAESNLASALARQSSRSYRYRQSPQQLLWGSILQRFEELLTLPHVRKNA